MGDPTYPLYPIANAVSAAGLFLVLLASLIHQNWNLGVAFLCFWLFLENLTTAIDTIIWSNNADEKLYIYRDIVSHLHLIAFAVKPMATLKLYLIASLRSVELPSTAERRRNLAIEWTLGLMLLLLVAGPIYYINQDERFMVVRHHRDIDEFLHTNDSVSRSLGPSTSASSHSPAYMYSHSLREWAGLMSVMQVTFEPHAYCKACKINQSRRRAR